MVGGGEAQSGSDGGKGRRLSLSSLLVFSLKEQTGEGRKEMDPNHAERNRLI